MTDRILALVAIIVLAILIWRVPRLDLAGVIAITLALAYWDFITSAGRKPQQR